MILWFEDIARKAGFEPRWDPESEWLWLPTEQATADRLAQTVVDMLPGWKPGDLGAEVTIGGDGPVWAYLAIGNALNGRIRKLTYVPRKGQSIVIFSHGA